jgi:hypothetical protein
MPGKIIGEILTKMINWQILNFEKDLTTVDATNWLKNNY